MTFCLFKKPTFQMHKCDFFLQRHEIHLAQALFLCTELHEGSVTNTGDNNGWRQCLELSFTARPQRWHQVCLVQRKRHAGIRLCVLLPRAEFAFCRPVIILLRDQPRPTCAVVWNAITIRPRTVWCHIHRMPQNFSFFYRASCIIHVEI